MDKVRLVTAALTYRVVKVHAGGQDALLVQDLELELVRLGDSSRDAGERFRHQDVWRFVDGVSRQRDEKRTLNSVIAVTNSSATAGSRATWS